MSERSRGADAVREGIRAGIGILTALKEALEDTFDEMRERGELSPERASEAMRSTMQRAQAAMDEAKERFDFVSRREFEALRQEVAELRSRVSDRLSSSAAGGAGPETPPDFPVDVG